MAKQVEKKRRKCQYGEMGKYCHVRWEREEARETGEEGESIEVRNQGTSKECMCMCMCMREWCMCMCMCMRDGKRKREM